MKLSQIGELSLLKGIRQRFHVRSKDIIVGIGDDTAVISPQNKNLLITTDMMVEGVHFDLGFVTPYQLGFKLVSVNVSDIYAMGGRPRHLLLDIAVNKNTDEAVINRFFDGAEEAMRLYGVSLVGGDLSSSKKGMVVSATLIGYAESPVKRSGARSGDRLYVTGNLGDSACGLELLKRIKKPVSIENREHPVLAPRSGAGRTQKTGGDSERLTLNSKLSEWGLSWNVVEPLLRRHLMPEARAPKQFARYATSMIDLSDGLFIDLSRLCDESNVGARIYIEWIPVSCQMRKVSSALGLDIFKLATSGGEDYELLFTAPADKKINATCIGEVTKSDRVVVDKSGRGMAFLQEGYQHFGVQR